MSDLQWQKDRCVEWLLDTWLRSASENLTRRLMARLPIRIEPSQLEATKRQLDQISDEEFGGWLEDRAEPWQQQLLWEQGARTIKSIEAQMPGSALIQCVAIWKRDGLAARTIVRQMLDGYRPS